MGRPRSHNYLPGGSSILWKMVPDFSENDNTVTTCEADKLSYYNIYMYQAVLWPLYFQIIAESLVFFKWGGVNLHVFLNVTFKTLCVKSES